MNIFVPKNELTLFRTELCRTLMIYKRGLIPFHKDIPLHKCEWNRIGDDIEMETYHILTADFFESFLKLYPFHIPHMLERYLPFTFITYSTFSCPSIEEANILIQRWKRVEDIIEDWDSNYNEIQIIYNFESCYWDESIDDLIKRNASYEGRIYDLENKMIKVGGLLLNKNNNEYFHSYTTIEPSRYLENRVIVYRDYPITENLFKECYEESWIEDVFPNKIYKEGHVLTIEKSFLNKYTRYTRKETQGFNWYTINWITTYSKDPNEEEDQEISEFSTLRYDYLLEDYGGMVKSGIELRVFIDNPRYVRGPSSTIPGAFTPLPPVTVGINPLFNKFKDYTHQRIDVLPTFTQKIDYLFSSKSFLYDDNPPTLTASKRKNNDELFTSKKMKKNIIN